MNNLISIIIPTYNREHLISETLDSIIKQSYINWECIVVDDGSTDNTDEVLKKYCENDVRFQYHQRPADRLKGANACRNYGFELSKGKYIKWFDSDDIMHPDFLEKQVNVLEENENLDFCASFSKMFVTKIEDDSGIFSPEIISENNAIFNFIVGKLYFLTPSTIWKRDILKDKELFDETLSNAHETDFNFRRLIEGNRFCYLKEILFYVRRGHKSIDSESISNPVSLQSLFDYFQKVFEYLNSDKSILSAEENSQLKKYVMYRQLYFFYEIRLLLSYQESVNNFRIIFKNLLRVKINFFSSFKIFIGTLTILFFRKGYGLIHIKEFDIRNKL